MARIAGVDLPGNKQVRIALTYIYGIGDPRALKILEAAGIDPFVKMGTLDEDQLNAILLSYKQAYILTKTKSKSILIKQHCKIFILI